MGALKDVIAISGFGTLFKFVSQGRSGVIVESLEDQKRHHVKTTTKMSALEDIAIYTDEKEVPLEEVFKTIFEDAEGAEVLGAKPTNDELKGFFEEILPDYDRDRVYVSDMKKIIKWYNQLAAKKLLVFEEEISEEEAPESVDSAQEEGEA